MITKVVLQNKINFLESSVLLRLLQLFENHTVSIGEFHSLEITPRDVDFKVFTHVCIFGICQET